MATADTEEGPDTWKQETDKPPASPPARRVPILSKLIGGSDAARSVAKARDRPCSTIQEIYRCYQQFVWSKLHRPDIAPESAEEIHQEVFLTLHCLILKDRLRESLLGVLATIATVTRHEICNYLRKRRRRLQTVPAEGIETMPDSQSYVASSSTERQVKMLGIEALPDSQADVEQTMADAEREQVVELILAKMPEDAAQLIRWIDLDGLTHPEVAEILERPLNTVSSQHRRAREKFRELTKRFYKADLDGDV